MRTSDEAFADLPLLQWEYQTVDSIRGPLLMVRDTAGVAYGEMVDIALADGSVRRGQVLEVAEGYAVVQVFEGTNGIDLPGTTIRFKGEVAKIGVSREMLGRILNGRGNRSTGGRQFYRKPGWKWAGRR